MGHYDHCYEAEEERREENARAQEKAAHQSTGLKFKTKVHTMTDEVAGEFRDSILEICHIAANMAGTAQQHKRLEILRQRIVE